MRNEVVQPAILEVDSSEIVTVWSPRAEAVYGVPQAEAIGRPISELADWNVSEHARNTYRRLSVGDIWVYHHEVRTRAGEDLILKTVTSRTPGGIGGPGALVCSTPVDPSVPPDIERTMPIRSIQGDTDRVLFCEDGQMITCVGPPGQRLAGHHRLDLVGRLLCEFVHPDDLPAWDETWRWALDTPRRTQSAVVRWRRADRGSRWMELNATNFLGEPGIDSVVLHCRELDDQMRPLAR